MMQDIDPGCEGVREALGLWIDAVTTGNIDMLDALLTDDFQLTCDAAINGGRMNKAEFIAFDRHIARATIEIVTFTARRSANVAITQVFAIVDEDFAAEPPGASVDQLGAMLGSGRTLAYATGWRTSDDQTWRCFQHHLFGPVDEG